MVFLNSYQHLGLDFYYELKNSNQLLIYLLLLLVALQSLFYLLLVNIGRVFLLSLSLKSIYHQMLFLKHPLLKLVAFGNN